MTEKKEGQNFFAPFFDAVAWFFQDKCLSLRKLSKHGIMANISELKFDDKNFNKHTEFGMSLLEKSLRQNGAGRSILIDKNNRIIAGNGVVEAAASINLDEVQIVETDGTKIVAVKRTDIDLDSKQGREMALADNAVASADLAWDMDNLADMQTEWDIDASDWGVELPPMELEAKETTEDDFEETDIPQRCKRGDIWQCGNHRLLCGDSTSEKDVARLMGKGHAELLFTSPPYSDMRTYNGDKDLSTAKLSKFIPTYKKHCEYQCVNLGLQIKQGEIVQYWDDYIKAAKNSGLKLMSWNVWQKPSAGNINNQAHFIVPCIHEWIFVFGSKFKELNRTHDKKDESIKEGKLKRFVRNNDGTMTYKGTWSSHYQKKKIESVICVNYEQSKDVLDHHPAPFNVALPSEYIQAFTKEGDGVAEPFGGSGTTMIACEQLNRKCYMMELDEHYCDVILARWEKFTGKKALKLEA